MGIPDKSKPITFNNLLIGASLNLFEVTTLGQPFEVIKTSMAANRQDSMIQVCLFQINRFS